MLVQPDLLVQQLLDRVLTALREDTSPLTDIMCADHNDEMRTYFQRTKMPVRLGYPRAMTELPGLYVLLGAAREANKFIGQTTLEDDDSALRYYEEWGSFFDCTVVVGCWSPNANVAAWTSAVTLWALLGGRSALQREGLQQQVVSQRDLEPDLRFLPDFIYRRDVTLTAQCPMSVRMEFFRLAGVTVMPTVANPGTITTTLTMR
jgi:hypothetical protein